jgi:hypothetical protein
MIKPSEYRIGNLVRWNPALKNPAVTFPSVVIEIAAIMGDKIGHIAPNLEHRSEPFEDDLVEKELHFKSLDELEPLPITEQFLVDAGFSDGSLSLPKNPPPIFLLWKNGAVQVFYTNEKEIGGNAVYVHQLQNLYFLFTGEELNIGGH